MKRSTALVGRLAVVSSLLALVALLPSTAHAAPVARTAVTPALAGWASTPTTIDSADASSAAPLVVDPQGDVTAGWLENYPAIGDDPQAGFFDLASQQWQAPQAVTVAGAGLTEPQLVVDASGTATLVWSEYYAESSNSETLFASRSTKGGPWTTPVPLNSLPGGTATNPQTPFSLVVDGQGNVTVAWLEQDLATTQYAIGAARFTSDIAAAPTRYPFLDGASPNAVSGVVPQLVVDHLGYVTAVWQERTGTGNAVQAARLDPAGSAWTAATDLDGPSPDADGSITPQVVVGGSGTVTTVWEETSAAQYAVQAARFVPGAAGAGGSWSAAATVAPALADADGAVTPRLVVDGSGAVTVVALDAALAVWPASFAAGGSSWAYPAVPLNAGTAYSLTPLSMAVDGTGTVTVSWLDNAAGLFVQAARGFGAAWTPAANLDGGNADGGTPVLMGVDPSGTVTASWMEGSAIQAARFSAAGSSWTAAATLDAGDLDNQIPPKMVVSTAGDVTVAWQEGPDLSGKYAIQAARFTAGGSAWTPATTLDGGTQTPDAYFSSMAQQIFMVVDALGTVTATWLETVGGATAVQAARFGPPTVTTEPAGQAVTAGQTATLSAACSGAPAPTLQWQVSTDGGATWSDDTADPGSTSGTLTLPAVGAAQDGDEYRMVCTNGVGNPATTTAALLRVAVVLATAGVVPSPPLDLTVHGGPVTLDWQPPEAPGGSPVTGYQVYRSTAGAAPTLIGTTVTTSYVDAGAETGTTSTYYAEADNAFGASAPSNTASLTVTGPPPAVTPCGSSSGNAAFVCALYEDLLGRAPDPAGAAAWAGALSAGTSRAQVAFAVATSAEGRADLVEADYQALLGRPADAAGLAAWVGASGTGATDEQVASGILGSAEFFADAGSTDSGFLARLYQVVLGRPIDGGGMATWLAALGAGASRAQVALAVERSHERHVALVRSYYRRFLGRPADPAGVASWTAALDAGATDEAVAAGILASPEFLAGAPGA